MKVKFLKNTFILIISATIGLAGCQKEVENPQNTNEEELITTISLEFINLDAPDEKVYFTYTDLDGDGGDAPIIIDSNKPNTILKANAHYAVNVEVLDQSKNPMVDITDEINEEAEAHQFFFVMDQALDLMQDYSDQDANNNPIGLENEFHTGAASEGNLRVVLKHMPGEKDKNATIKTGATDIDVTFKVVIQ